MSEATPQTVANVEAWPWPHVVKVWAWLLGVPLPVVCFLLTSAIFSDARPNLSGDAQRLLHPQGAFPFFPLLLYSMICLNGLLTDRPGFSQRFVVRWGIYLGVILALHFWVVLILAMEGDRVRGPVDGVVAVLWGIVVTLMAAGILIGGSVLIVVLLKHEWGCIITLLLTLVTFFVWYILAILAIVLVLFCAPTIAFLVYGAAALELRRRQGRFRFTLAQLLVACAILALYCSAWRVALRVG